MEPETITRARSLELLRTIVWAQRKIGEELIRERELSYEQGFVIGYLGDNPGAIQRDIAVATRTSASNVSVLIQGLERRGMVERRPDDRDVRVKRVFATTDGLAMIDGLKSAMAGVDEAILTPLTRSDRLSLERLLDKITAGLPELTGP